jgi:hypothetical protein
MKLKLILAIMHNNTDTNNRTDTTNIDSDNTVHACDTGVDLDVQQHLWLGDDQSWILNLRKSAVFLHRLRAQSIVMSQIAEK